ncbi:GAF domain-containing sensor histidine kinase [Nocardioides nanhaiensis]|uniref:histidine kinase n=1 Tax=Nocardioides nanhaiensis TaxID=1476871 RepID=A0ABP8VW51_9ACTN
MSAQAQTGGPASHPDGTVQVLLDLTRTLAGPTALHDLLDLAVHGVAGLLRVDAAGVSLASADADPAVTAASGHLAACYHELLSHLGSGEPSPSLTVLRSGEALSISDLTTDDRFPTFAGYARSEGLLAVDVLPLHGDRGCVGTLELVRSHPGDLRSEDLHLAHLLAEVAAAHVLNAQARQAQRDLVATVAHELRTPLTSITGFLEMLAEADLELGGHQQRWLEAIHRNTLRLGSLAEDLVSAQGPDRRDASGHVEVDLAAVVRTVETAVAPVVLRHGIETEFAVPHRRVAVLGDEQDLESLMTNLVGNALKFTPPGGRVHCSLAVVATRAHVQVSDDGPGIPAHELPHLFTRHYRTRSARSARIEGSGLGLAIAASVARHHGGEISVRSQLGEGSVFTVDLPLLLEPGQRGPALADPERLRPWEPARPTESRPRPD